MLAKASVPSCGKRSGYHHYFQKIEFQSTRCLRHRFGQRSEIHSVDGMLIIAFRSQKLVLFKELNLYHLSHTKFQNAPLKASIVQQMFFLNQHGINIQIRTASTTFSHLRPPDCNEFSVDPHFIHIVTKFHNNSHNNHIKYEYNI